MSRPLFALIVIVVVALALLGMWLGWRARARRDRGVRTLSHPPVGQLLAEFASVFYVSTTPVGEPLVRVAVQGLRYRGNAEVLVHADGLTVQVDGESAVHFSAAQLRGSASAGRRVGKAVEHGGLALVRWVPLDESGNADVAATVLESSFRFVDKAEQHRFAQAIDDVTPTSMTTVSQEDEK